jgi:SAM-dependent methyltransferase
VANCIAAPVPSAAQSVIATDSRQEYLEHVAALQQRLDRDTALRAAIGGEYIAMGVLEHQLLRSLGLRDGHHVIDVGCGSGRLAYQLARYPNIRYFGTDVVPDLIDYAARVSQRIDWNFCVTEGTTIPAADGGGDFACFFSVFTHLPHEQSYRYLREAKRVLRPGGTIVFSFLEFRIPCHWEQFQHSQQHSNAGQHLNQFMDREAIGVWANKLGLVVESFFDGDRPHIPLAEALVFESGLAMSGLGNLGQSIAVLRVPPQP